MQTAEAPPYPPAFEHAVEHVLAVEGGWVHDSRDPGGETNHGISKRAYPHLDIQALTRDDAAGIYHRDYWQPLGAGRLEPRLALLAFDAAVNHGLARAQRWLRDHPTFGRFLAHRLRFYARLSTFSAFGRGWVNRMAAVIDAAASLPAPLLPVSELHVRRYGGDWQRFPLDPVAPARVVGSKLYANERKGL